MIITEAVRELGFYRRAAYNACRVPSAPHPMKILKVVFINILVLLGLFALVEGGMRIYYAITDKIPPHADLAQVREWRWVKARMADGKVSFDPRFVYDEIVGWRNAPNIDRTVQNEGHVRTNAAGMRNDTDFPVDPVPGRRRLMIVGDSYSFGYGVDNDQTFAYLLAQRMPDWDVMNFAVSATGTDQHYLMYERYGERYRPDIVLLGFYVLDYNRNTYSFRDYAKPLFVPLADGRLELTHVPVTPPETLIAQYRSGEKRIGGWHYSYAVAAFKQVLIDRMKRDRGPDSLGRRTLSGIMQKFATRVRGNGAVPVWVIFPIRDILSKEESKYREISEFAKAEAERLGMPVLDLEPVYRAYLTQHPEVKTLWRPEEIGGHLSVEGNAVSADAIYAFLRQQGLLDAGQQAQ